MEPKTVSFVQTGTNETKPKAEEVSRKEATEKFENEAAREAGTIERKAQGTGAQPEALHNCCNRRIPPSLHTLASDHARILPDRLPAPDRRWRYGSQCRAFS